MKTLQENGLLTLITDDGHSALVQLRAFIANQKIATGQRLPPERELVDLLGVTRNDLRKALALLEAEGSIWRHVGRGTFVGARPDAEASSLPSTAERASPVEVMNARILIEPALAGFAAVHASSADLKELRTIADRCRNARNWREYEAQDNALHRAIAEASNNTVLTAVFDTLNSIRRTVVWGRDRGNDGPPPADHHSFDQHDRILDAINNRDAEMARAEMRQHLDSVSQKLLG
ncbi:FadR/GntR family transcriptional regulator [Dinoroseobacter sp. S76]|uniref:FadR/GntR family transcriptional regulator n=1 Tax=Dinoroseobacter sp. S76 TaxID=3415124 RepID=UPI003C7E0706